MFKPIVTILLILCVFVPVLNADEYAMLRQKMVKLIEADVKDTSYYLNKTILNPRVMKAMGKVPRHQFVPENQKDRAYKNQPLPIGHGQTISQPYIVAIMTELLQLAPTNKVLELGTGSGYQAAILSKLVNQVYTIEVVEALGEQAKARLVRLGYDNVHVKIGDGYYGWKEHAPYDAIIVTAAGSHIPPSLVKQLKPGGVMVIPVGSRFMTQQLLLVRKDEDNKVTTEQILPVRFVPLTGSH